MSLLILGGGCDVQLMGVILSGIKGRGWRNDMYIACNGRYEHTRHTNKLARRFSRSELMLERFLNVVQPVSLLQQLFV